MKKTLAIFNKEFKSFFYSPLAYVIIAIFTLITGYLFYNVLSWFVEQSFMMTMQAQQYRQAPPKFNVNLRCDYLLRRKNKEPWNSCIQLRLLNYRSCSENFWQDWHCISSY